MTIRVYDLAGRAVRTLRVDAVSGWNSIALDARDDTGSELASGTYLYRVKTAREARTGRFVIVR